MKRWRKVLLLVLCLVLVTSLSLVACKHNKEDNGYSIYVKSLGGLGLSDVTVTVELTNSTVSGETDASGKYYFEAQPGVYKVTVGELPLGYTLVGNNDYKTSAEELTLVIYASSAVIQEEIPSNKVYKEGDIIYDFSITDKTGSQDATYTLSEVLAEKKMVLLNFWNTHCDPCMREMPELELAYREYQEDAEVFGINVPLLGTDRQADVRAVRSTSYTDADGNQYSLTFPLTIDDNEMPYHFAMTAIPVSVVIDRYGVIALIHTGSMDKSEFAALFAKYTSDNYVQDGSLGGSGGPNEGEDVLERVKPDVSQQESSVIERAINGSGFTGTWYPETAAGDAEYSWPWLVGETNGELYIYPANHGVNYSFATIYTDLTITQADISSPNGKVVLVFDLQWACENLCDYFYVIINNSLVYEYTGTEQWGAWQECYALVADEPGDYSLALMYVKDQQLSEGADTVRIKNVRLISTQEISVDSLDMPRDAARDWNGTSFSSYINVVKDGEGFYHKDTVDGPYVLADLMGSTAFNKRLNTTWGVGEFAVNNYFNYNKVDEDDPAYDPSKDDTDAISEWAMAGNNSELYGLTVVNDDLIALLNKFIKSQVSNSNDKTWLEFCRYFDHYGVDPSDTGINTPNRNPVRGIIDLTAVPMVDYHDGAFEDLDNIPDEYKNLVVLPRLIVPRGYKYLFTPDKDGVYRFRSQSKELADTMAWLYEYKEGSLVTTEDQFLVTTEDQLENPDQNYNFILTYYLKAGHSYVIATCFADLGVTGEYTFTAEYIGEYYYSWQYASRGYFTTKDEEMTEIVNYMNVQPVLYEGKYYNAKKDAQGNYLKDGEGNYIPNLNDPIYVDFMTNARFFEAGSLELSLLYFEKANVCKTLNGIFSLVWNKTNLNWPATTPLRTIKGSAISSSDWDAIIERLYLVYGDNCIIDPETDAEIVQRLIRCSTASDVADILIANYLSLFNQTNWRPDGDYGIDQSRFKDYTELVKEYYQMALSNEGTAERGYADAGSVHLTEELRDALDMFCKRIGGFPELDTDWIRLCAHFEYIGPYTDAE